MGLDSLDNKGGAVKLDIVPVAATDGGEVDCCCWSKIVERGRISWAPSV
jgi:hypothetical protein